MSAADLLRQGLRWLGESFDVLGPEPPRLNCRCIRDQSVIVACPCGIDTCDQHRTHDCKEPINA